jgi:hypothetical protein
LTISFQLLGAPNVSEFLGLSPDAWIAVFTGFNALVLVVGVPIALSNLKLITKQQYLASITRFHDELASTEPQRRFLFRDFPKQRDYSDIAPEAEKPARDIINLLNRVALLIDEQMLPPRIVFSLTHTMIIRCWYQLERYVAFEEHRLGGRYARRVRRLQQRAKKFHDSRPHQRIHTIKLFGKEGRSKVIYRTQRKKGISGVIQRIEWWSRYGFGWY